MYSVNLLFLAILDVILKKKCFLKTLQRIITEKYTEFTFARKQKHISFFMKLSSYGNLSEASNSSTMLR